MARKDTRKSKKELGKSKVVSVVKAVSYGGLVACVVFIGATTCLGYLGTRDIPIKQVDVNKRQAKSFKSYEKGDKNIKYGENVEYVTQEQYLKHKLTNKEAEELFTNYGRGTLYLQGLGMSMPVYEGTSEQALLSGVGTGNPFTTFGFGNTVLLGHNLVNGMLFSNLYKSKIGDLVFLTNYSYVCVYRVDKNYVTDDFNTSIMADIPNKSTDEGYINQLKSIGADNLLEYINMASEARNGNWDKLVKENAIEFKDEELPNVENMSDIISQRLILKIEELQDDQPSTLTMITCEGGLGTSSRRIVTGHLVEIFGAYKLDTSKVDKVLTKLNRGKQKEDIKDGLSINAKAVKPDNHKMNIFQKLWYWFETGLRTYGIGIK